MDRAQHYREAERLLDLVSNHVGETCTQIIAEAQVHATLALTTARNSRGVDDKDWAWTEATT